MKYHQFCKWESIRYDSVIIPSINPSYTLLRHFLSFIMNRAKYFLIDYPHPALIVLLWYSGFPRFIVDHLIYPSQFHSQSLALLSDVHANLKFIVHPLKFSGKPFAYLRTGLQFTLSLTSRSRVSLIFKSSHPTLPSVDLQLSIQLIIS